MTPKKYRQRMRDWSLRWRDLVSRGHSPQSPSIIQALKAAKQNRIASLS